MLRGLAVARAGYRAFLAQPSFIAHVAGGKPKNLTAATERAQANTKQEYLGFINRPPPWPNLCRAHLADRMCISAKFYRFGDCLDFDEYAGISESTGE